MLMLIHGNIGVTTATANFNTSHVNVNLRQKTMILIVYYHFNTSHVNVNQ